MPAGGAPAKLHDPAASVTVEETVVQAVPDCCWSCTAAAASAGRIEPLTADGVAVASTRGATAILARPARTSPQASRYCVVACGLTIVANEPSAASARSPAGAQTGSAAVFDSSDTASTP